MTTTLVVPPTPVPQPVAGACDLRAIVDECHARGSRIGYFAALYTHVESAIADSLARGEFDHPQMLVEVNDTFLARYLAAYDAHGRGVAPSPVWQAAFDATEDPRVSVVQQLLLGMNAHINFDLAIAVNDALDPGELRAFQPDFNRMNDLLASLLHEVVADIALCWPLLRWINAVAEGAEDAVLSFSMRVAREQAWRSTLELSALSGSAREHAIASMGSVACGLARDVAHPRGIARAIAAIIHAGERGSVAEIIDDLLC